LESGSSKGLRADSRHTSQTSVTTPSEWVEFLRKLDEVALKLHGEDYCEEYMEEEDDDVSNES